MSGLIYNKFPDGLDYKSGLSTSNSFSIIPSSGGTFGTNAEDATIMVSTPNEAAFMDPKSCYITFNCKTKDASGAGVSTAVFENSANCVINRLTVKARRSRITLSDMRDFNKWSVIVNKMIKNPQAHVLGGDVTRGMPMVLPSGETTNLAYGGSSRGGAEGVSIAQELKDGNREFRVDLQSAPFFNGDKFLPVGLMGGGLEIAIRFEDFKNAFVDHKDNNAADATTATQYEISNMRFHCTLHYCNQNMLKAIKAKIDQTGIVVPYNSMVSLTHAPQSQNETLRVSNSLSFVKSLFLVHTVKADKNKTGNYSISNFGCPRASEIQISAGGILTPNVPLELANETKYDFGSSVYYPTSGEQMKELQEAFEHIGMKFDPAKIEKHLVERLLASSAKGSSSPTWEEMASWNGHNVIGLSLGSVKDDDFSSVYNRQLGLDTVSKTDMLLNIKYAASPSAYEMSVFLIHGNYFTLSSNAAVVPYQFSF
jgi:hypothetical protein